MACDRMRELAFLSIDGELTDAERAELSAHVATCAECRAAQAAAARVASGVRQLVPPPVPLGFAERTLKRVDDDAPPRRRPRPLPLMVPIAAVAATLVAAAIFVVELRRPRTEEVQNVASAPQAQAPTVPAGESQSGGFAAGDRSGGVTAGRLETPPGAPDESGRDAPRELADEEKSNEADAKKAKEEADANWKSGDFVVELAAGSAADALRRVVSYKEAGRLKDAVAQDLDEELAKRPDLAKDGAAADKGDAKYRGGDDATQVAPTLRFLRVRGDRGSAPRFDALLAKRDVRDGAGRIVVDLDEAEAKTLRPRLDVDGLKCEELASAEWLHAAEAAVAKEGRLAAAAPAPATAAPAEKAANAPPGPPTGAPTGTSKGESVARGEPRSKVGAPKKSDDSRKSKPGEATGGGGAGPGTPPRKRERWFILFTSG